MSETLSVNSNLSHYRIVSKLGAGGMGEVWLAKDTRLDRKVAIKVLPEGFAEDAERVARFQREAHVLASLNHPNIGAIYGLEDSNGILALVMELVEGPTLADRIARGPIALDEAAPIAKQIAEGLEYAHERGVIHRDLKPANIKVTVDGGVKVLDFGLAKVFTEETHDSDLSHSPTLIKGTQAGMILGTAAYMSPEQAKGKAVDRRSDIWAFGCVLYEMLTGKQAFSGETLTDTLAAVVRAEPDWGELPEATPRVIRKLLARCLTKDLRQRLRDIGEARIVLDNPQDDKPGDVALQGAAKEARPFLDSFVWIAGIALAFLAGGVSVWFLRPASSEIPLRKLELHVPALDVNSSYGYSISPNGRMIAYVSNRRLWIRDLDRLEPREVASTEGAGQLVWVDRTGKQLGMVGAPGSIGSFTLSSDDKRVAVARRDPQTGQSDIWLHDLVRDIPSRFTFDPADDDSPLWSPDGSHIVFRSNREGTSNLYQKVANGAGQEELLLKTALDKQPTSWSSDGRFIIYYQTDPKTKVDVWVLPLVGDRTPFSLLQTEFNELQGRLSPDMRWIAYTSNESGKSEVYVRTFPVAGGQWQVSKDGGTTPRWRRDGKELFYIGGGKVMAVAVSGGTTFEAGTPQALFDPVQGGNLFPNYAVTADGQRFLFNTAVEETRSNQVTVVLNWIAEVKK